MLRTLLLFLAALISFSACADEASVKKILEKNYPQIGKVDNVFKAPFL